MVNWIMFLAFILIYSQLMFHAIQAPQPPGYKGCYPSSKFKTLHSSRVSRNDGVYCIGFCEASKYRYAATQGQYCKCLFNVPTLNSNESSTRCVNRCLGRLSERCGGEDLVSFYDIQEFPKCVNDSSGLTALKGDYTNPESKQDDDNSATKCASYCEKLQYKFSGTKGNRCICGEKINEEFKESKCETTCPGNEEETCGGEDSVSLRHTGSQEPFEYPTCVEDPHGIVALKGDGTKRLMDADYENSATRCAIYCKESDYPLSGTKNNFCICGKRLNTDIIVSSKCETECPGNKTEACGGDDSVSVRFTGHVTTQEVTSSTTTTTNTAVTSNTTTSNTTTTTNTAVTSNTTTTANTAVTSSTTTTANTAVTSNTMTTANTAVTSSTTTTANTAVTSNTMMTANTAVTSNTMTTANTAVTSNTMTTANTAVTSSTTTTANTENTSHAFPSTNASNTAQPKIDTQARASKGSPLTAVYITLPIVIIVAVSVVVIVCLVLRHKRQKRETNVNWPVQSSSNWEPNSERNEMSCRVQCEEISSQAIQADDKCDAEYSTVSNPNDIMNSNADYDSINAKPSAATNAHGIYSHFKCPTGNPDSNVTDNTYSHLGSTSRQCTNQTDNTYNKFQFSQLAKNTSAPSLEQDDQNSVYDSTNARDNIQVNDMSEYSHLPVNTFNTFK